MNNRVGSGGDLSYQILLLACTVGLLDWGRTRNEAILELFFCYYFGVSLGGYRIVLDIATVRYLLISKAGMYLIYVAPTYVQEVLKLNSPHLSVENTEW